MQVSLRPLRPLALPLSTALAGLLLTACAASGDGMRYVSNGKAPLLETPPDVTQLAGATRTAGGAVPAISASDYQAGLRERPVAPPTALERLGDVRIAGDGSHHWLVVGRTPQQLWAPLRSFWQASGFVLTVDDPARGLMETDWAESRAQPPQDIVRATIGKVFDSDHATGVRERFRTRIEATAAGTEIYISHRGMQEAFGGARDPDKAWRVQPADPDLEADYLRRLMARLGTPDADSRSAGGTPRATPMPVVRTAPASGQPTLELAEGFDLAWRHVGLALDRTGFTVEDRNRSTGTYFVRYVPPNPNRTEPGLFDKAVALIKPVPVEPPLKLGIVVKSEAGASQVSVVSEQGAPLQTANAQRIVDVLAADLR